MEGNSILPEVKRLARTSYSVVTHTTHSQTEKQAQNFGSILINNLRALFKHCRRLNVLRYCPDTSDFLHVTTITRQALKTC